MTDSRRARRDRRILKKLAALSDRIDDLRDIIRQGVNTNSIHSRTARLLADATDFLLFLQHLERIPFYPPLSSNCAGKALSAPRRKRRA